MSPVTQIIWTPMMTAIVALALGSLGASISGLVMRSVRGGLVGLLLGLGVFALGFAGTILGLIDAFRVVGAVGAAEASRKQELLSAGIASAMHHTALGLPLSAGCIVLGAVALRLVERRAPRR